LQKFLSTDHPFDSKDYTPDDLIAIDSDFTANNAQNFRLRAEAAVHFADMARHFWNDFDGDRLFLTSAYRSP
jgi:LAS superfamily LD-carboxypeptidase LdcB